MCNYLPLTALQVNEKGKIKDIFVDDAIKRRLLDLGLIENTEIDVLQKSPFGDPVIALRNETASNIFVEKVKK